ncbi:metalloregulator ArsR/SmtB family transcription factor [Intrasporangium sp.]|uniref:ArsR/SmtB family transcription factor n=1 Tax=Intrasporangium sp. TaxID=1925024 RepID=UPI00293B77D6|nr:metalloregulator ArsR/SmtB family transcription factor [Intrasporangium sp.]MDV3223539.1 metalloregulator ArsR/SmtB family transcription factor [Intrasporangium sp.]
MHALDVLGDPVRRRLLELLSRGELSSGELARVIGDEFGISHPAVSQHLKVLRDNGFTTVRAEGTRRLYSVDPAPFEELDMWLSQFRAFWTQRLDALGTELRRGSRAAAEQTPAATEHANQDNASHTGGPHGHAQPSGPARRRRPRGRNRNP